MQNETKGEVLAKLVRAERDGMCFTLRQGEQAPRALRGCISDGSAVSPMPRCYARREYWSQLDPKDRTLHQLRAIQAINPHWIACGCSAALAHGLDIPKQLIGNVEFANGGSGRRNGIRHRDIQVRETVACQGVVCTGLTETLFRCLVDLGFPFALALADSALAKKWLTAEGMTAVLERDFSQMPGVRRAVRVAKMAIDSSPGPDASVARGVIWMLGYEMPMAGIRASHPLDPWRSMSADLVWMRPHQEPLIALTGYRARRMGTADQPGNVLRLTDELVADTERLDKVLSRAGAPKRE